MRKTRVAIGGKAQGPRTTYTQHVGHVPARSKYSPHAGAKQKIKGALRLEGKGVLK